jgi:hypothetical protein
MNLNVKRKKLVLWVIIGIGLCLMISVACSLFPDEYQRIPDTSTVKNMTAILYNSPTKRPDLPVFDVPGEDIPIILQCLEPTEREFMAPDWQVLGDLKLTTIRGTEIEIHLFWTRDRKGAFAVGPWGRQRYYRGGNDSIIEESIRTAYAKTLKKGT